MIPDSCMENKRTKEAADAAAGGILITKSGISNYTASSILDDLCLSKL